MEPKTEALIITHAEKIPDSNNNGLFQRISDEIELTLPNREIYFLGFKSKDVHSKRIPQVIRQHWLRMAFIPADTYTNQFLVTKERLLESGIHIAEIGGIAYECCVEDLYHLLRSEDGPRYIWRDFELASQRLFWDKERFRKVYSTVIDAKIRPDLTDKFPQ